MKCFACDYEYYHDDLEGGARIGNEKFDYFETMKKIKHYDGTEYQIDIQSILLFSCPKCHTVRTEGTA
jgi:hypothetical protein